MFYIRHALVFIYTILFVLLICGLCMTLFESPPISITNLAGSRLVNIENTMLGLSYPLNNPVPGANVSGGIRFTMWTAVVDLSIDVSYYGYGEQVIHQVYNLEDIACKEFTNRLRTAQVFAVLSIFTSFFCLVLVISSFFSRLFLPVLWVMTWVNVACVSSACSMLLKVLCERSPCEGSVGIPPFMSFAVPEGGFAVYIICMFSYLFTSVMCVFL